MRETLIPVFGELGALVAQFLITVVVVLALIAAVYWLVRRFSGLRLGGIGRGRVPRLAIVDAMAVDSRRRLVLIRRDNVEHLILIGGPSDLVVEPSIVRMRQRAALQPARAQPQQPDLTAPSLPPGPPIRSPESPKANAPFPFPPPRAFQQSPAETAHEPSFRPQRQTPAVASPPAGVAEEASPTAPVADTPLPTSTRPVAPTVASNDQPSGDGVTLEPFLPEMVRPEAYPVELPLPRQAEPIAVIDESADPDQRPFDLGEEARTVVENDPSAASPAQRAATAGTVTELEEEMARLLGEITIKQSSP